MHPSPVLSPAAQAFDAVAASFDERYGGWRSVAAQRRAVRSALLHAFPPGARVIEIGGGTGEDALWLARRGRDVLMTDASPAMVGIASRKLREIRGSRAEAVPAEALESFARSGVGEFDGGFSNFAALNCVPDLTGVARGLAWLLRAEAPLLLVLFGPLPPGEVAVQLARGDVRAAFRRLARGEVPARLGGRDFTVWYHRPREIDRAFAPWFRMVSRRGVGVFVPPSAAEPWISGHPGFLRGLEWMDRKAARPLALLGDHILYSFCRTAAPPPDTSE